jgi:hypothetical protein
MTPEQSQRRAEFGLCIVLIVFLIVSSFYR